MPLINPDEEIRADHFINESERDATPTNDEGRVAKLENSGFIHPQLIGLTGTILPFGGSSAPSFWLLCDGSAVSRTTYDKLFDVIGTSYGAGDGSTTFNVPDLVGRAIVGADPTNSRLGADLNAANESALGDSGGKESHQLTKGEMPSHDHGYSDVPGVDSVQIKDNSSSGAAGGGSGDGTWNFQSEGGDETHQNMPPYQVVNYIIGT